MLNRIGLWIVVAALFAPGVRAQQTPAPAATPGPAAGPAAGPTPADVALAGRVADLSKLLLTVKQPEDLHFRQAAALFEGAIRLDPNEPRYPRFLSDAMRQIGDEARAIDALVAYRKLRPLDQSAQLELIELYLNRIETVEKKLDYLNDLRRHASIPAEVKSQISLHAARLLLERGDEPQAGQVLREATTLDPLNFSAWLLRRDLLPDDDRDGRLEATLNALRADPAHPHLLASVGRELADAGLANESLRWFAHALTSGTRDPEGLLLEYASQLLLADQLPEARKRLDALVAGNPENYPAVVMRLHVARRDGQAEDVERLSAQARNALLNRLATIRKAMGVESATTRPVAGGASEIPPLDGDVALWKQQPDEQLKEAYLQAVGDLAWFEVYFDNRPDEAEKLIRHFSSLANETNVFAARTAGWIFLVQNRRDEAKVKLEAAAPNDPYAAAGLLKLLPEAERAKAHAEAQKILAASPSGPRGALLAEALREFGAKVAPAAHAESVSRLVKNFPMDWLSVLQSPRQFYNVRAEPQKVSFEYGEPLWVKVTVTNTGRYDLRIAPDGLLKPAIWLEAQLQGMFRGAQPVYAYERMSEAFVLRPRQSIAVMIRVDIPGLARFLESNPLPAVPIDVTVRTNPVLAGDRPVSTPGGYATDTSRPMERGASPFNQVIVQRLIEVTQRGAGVDQMRAVQRLEAYHRMIAAQAQKTEDLVAADQVIRKAVDAVRGDDEPSVRAWAGLMYATGSKGDELAPALQRMLLDDAWQSRLLGIVAILSTGSDRIEMFLTDLLAKEADPTVKALADATVTQFRQRPATQPVEGQPAGAPQNVPGK